MVDEAFSMAKARAKWRAKEQAEQQHLGARMEQHRKLVGANDGRRLNATGRTAQWNLKTRPETKQIAKEYADKFGYETVVEFVEDAIAAFVAAGGKNGHGKA